MSFFCCFFFKSLSDRLVVRSERRKPSVSSCVHCQSRTVPPTDSPLTGDAPCRFGEHKVPKIIGWIQKVPWINLCVNFFLLLRFSKNHKLKPVCEASGRPIRSTTSILSRCCFKQTKKISSGCVSFQEESSSSLQVFFLLLTLWPYNFMHLSLWHFGRLATTFFILVWHFAKPDDGNLPLSVGALGWNSLPSHPCEGNHYLYFIHFYFYQPLFRFLMSFNRLSYFLL